MKRRRILLALGITFVLLMLAILWAPREQQYATPAECVEAHWAGREAGNVDKILNTFWWPLNMERRFDSRSQMAENLRATMKEVKSWVLLPIRGPEGARAVIDVDEIRTTGTRRTRVYLERHGIGWWIDRIDRPEDVPTPIPYGTHISKVPE